jgi:hypothetical protein
MQRGFVQLLHSTTSRTFVAIPILMLNLFLSLIMFRAKDLAAKNCWVAEAFFFLAATRNATFSSVDWISLVSGNFCASTKLRY